MNEMLPKIGRNEEIFENSLNDWRKILLVREEPLSEIFVLAPENLKELQVLPRLGAPSFIRRIGKRWCQWKDIKGGRKFFAPAFSLAGKPGKKNIGGKSRTKKEVHIKCRE